MGSRLLLAGLVIAATTLGAAKALDYVELGETGTLGLAMSAVLGAGIATRARPTSSKGEMQPDALEWWRKLVACCSDHVVVVDSDGEVVMATESLTTEMLDAVLYVVESRRLAHDRQTAAFADFEWTAVLPAKTMYLRTRLRELDPGEPGSGLVATTLDVTNARAASPIQRRLDNVDPLTGLAGPLAMAEEAARRLAELADLAGHICVIVFEIERLQSKLATMDKEECRQVLELIGAAIRSLLHWGDFPCWLGGDQFAVVYRSDGASAAGSTAKRLRSAFHYRLVASGSLAGVRLLAGAAMTDDCTTEASDLIRRAEAAVAMTSEGGGEDLVVFDARVEADVREQREFATLLRSEAVSNQFVVHYQPVVDLRSGEVVGAEALVRWQHPIAGLLPPARFIPLLEREGLLPTVGQSIVDMAVAQAARWDREGHHLRVAINLGASQLAGLKGMLEQSMANHQCSADVLSLEITETEAVSDLDQSIEVLGQLRGLGIKILLDDFGQGWSTLGMLRALPLDGIKIDRAFVSGLPGSLEDQAIVRTIAVLGSSLGLKVIAEGVETNTQWSYLKSIGVDSAQGYLLGRPTPAAKFTAMLTTGPQAHVLPLGVQQSLWTPVPVQASHRAAVADAPISRDGTTGVEPPKRSTS